MFQHPNQLWNRILISKYKGWRGLPEGPTRQYFSYCWSDLRSTINHSSMEDVSSQFIWKLGRGDQILFWEDSWVNGGITLKEKFPELYQISSQKLQTVANMGSFVKLDGNGSFLGGEICLTLKGGEPQFLLIKLLQ